MSKKKPPSTPPKSDRYLGIYRSDGRRVLPTKIFCRWPKPFVLATVDLGGVIAMHEWAAYRTEAEAIEVARTYGSRSDDDHWCVIDLSDIGPREIPVDTDQGATQ